MLVVRRDEAVALDDATPATTDGLEPPERASWKPAQSHRQRLQVRRRREEDVLVRPANGLEALLVQVVVCAVATADKFLCQLVEIFTMGMTVSLKY